MTESTAPASEDMTGLVPDGFRGQRLRVLPRPVIDRALLMPGTSMLVVTDCGFFPKAVGHGFRRLTGIDEAVVIMCAAGSGWCEVDGVHFPVSPGQIAVLPPGHPHAYAADDDEPWTVWWMHVGGTGAADLLRAAGITAAQPVRTPVNAREIISMISEVVRWTDRDETQASLVAAAGAAWHVLSRLGISRIPNSHSVAAVDAAATAIRANVAAPLSVAQLAADAGLSSSHFAALFTRYHGVPPQRFQAQLRMAQARELLVTTDHSVSQIAHAVGYRDAFYFSRIFRRINGVTARRYRESFRSVQVPTVPSADSPSAGEHGETPGRTT